MERVVSQGAGKQEQVAQVVLECEVTVPCEALPWLLPALRKAGIEARDTGQRGSSEEGIDTLADVRVRVPA